MNIEAIAKDITNPKCLEWLRRAETAEARCVGLEAMLVDAQHEVDALKGAEREGEGDPRKILTELFTEEMLDEPDLLADLVVARLGSRGFIIVHRDRL